MDNWLKASKLCKYCLLSIWKLSLKFPETLKVYSLWAHKLVRMHSILILFLYYLPTCCQIKEYIYDMYEPRIFKCGYKISNLARNYIIYNFLKKIFQNDHKIFPKHNPWVTNPTTCSLQKKKLNGQINLGDSACFRITIHPPSKICAFLKPIVSPMCLIIEDFLG